MEKPCFYLKSAEQAKAEDEENEKRQPDKLIYKVAYQLRDYRQALYCDRTKGLFYEQDRIFSQIIVVDRNDRVKLQIVVPRKDNVHLVKK